MQGVLKLLRPADLVPHEAVDPERVTALIEELRASGEFYPPVLVDDATRVILDGHHRWRASTTMGLRALPCYCVDYLGDPMIRVMSRRPGISVSKPEVLAMAKSGNVYPLKTTRHMYDLPESVEPIALDRLLGN
ncbi:MAG TPA: ParB N-terminal domain-containing protein [Candidatus Krumholzibacteria bacterium]|nr:ParB N-terminal domain-containing protein [Candidatus Krumholzibacteria bacterium]